MVETVRELCEALEDMLDLPPEFDLDARDRRKRREVRERAWRVLAKARVEE